MHLLTNLSFLVFAVCFVFYLFLFCWFVCCFETQAGPGTNHPLLPLQKGYSKFTYLPTYLEEILRHNHTDHQKGVGGMKDTSEARVDCDLSL